MAAPGPSWFLTPEKRSVVVRSSGIGEDSAGVSFAGLHESFVNLRGVEEILLHIRLVWAHQGVVREKRLAPQAGGVVQEEVPITHRDRPPLAPEEIPSSQ